MSEHNEPLAHHVVDTIVTPDKKIAENPRQQYGCSSGEGKTKKINFSTILHKFNFRKKQVAQPINLTSKSKFPKKKILIGLGVFLLILLIIGGTLGAVAFHTYQIAMNLKTQAFETQVVATKLKDDLKAQNLPAVEVGLIDVQTRVSTMKTEYERLSFYKRIPIAKSYYQDGLHAFAAGEAGVRAGLKTVDAIVPYADVLGFAGEGSFTGGTAEDRIRLLLETLSKVSPVIDDITAELQTVQTELAAIDPNRYPEQIQGTQLRSQIVQGQQLVDGAVTGITEFRPVLEVLPQIAGSEERKKYLVIFQNDNELRPTGGFMTAYAVMFVEDGKVTPEKSDDIYELDKKFRKNIPIPEALGRYLTSEKRFNLRDMNVSPDFKVSMDTFYEHYKEAPGEPSDIDGIISVDTNLLSDLVKILGPVDVPGYGTFSAENDARCDCPQIIYTLSEIVDRPTPYIREDRKGIIAPMMQSILQKAYTAPKEMWPQLFELAWKKIEEKHVQFYFFDETHQVASEKINASGRMTRINEEYDYLAVIDSNLGGAKSNLFVQSEGVLTTSQPENGVVKHTLTLKYKNPRKGDNCNLEAGLLCLNGVLRDWVRVYVPEGAQLISTQGLDTGTEKSGTELGFTVFEGSFRLAPLSNSSIVIEYTVPYTNTDQYNLQLRKQAGTDNWTYLLDVDGHEEEVVLDKDKTVTIDF